MRDAITPITAFAFGMSDRQRMKNCVKYGHIYTAVIMLVGFIALEIFAVPFSGIFDLSGETQELCISAMRIVSTCFVFAGVNIAFQGLFQAMRGGVQSLVVSVCRQILFIFPFALIFAGIAKSDPQMNWLIWLTFPIAEILTAVIAVIMFVGIWKKNKFRS